jgi:hypothetical protein
LKTMSRQNFDEIMDFFQKGLNLFKIQVSLKLDLFPGFLFQNPFGILYHHSKFGKFWTSERFWFLISKFEPSRVFE